MPSITGCISASFAEAEGQTKLSDRTHAYPLKIAKAFPFEGGQLGVYVMDASPGIMSGDRYELDWRFGEETQVFITNQSYTKVHPAHAHPLSEQKQSLTLLRGSYVEYMPEPLMLYKDAALSSTMEVRMEPGSALLLTDLVCPGRTHRGEIFHYTLYQNKLSVYYDNELIYAARQRVEPEKQRLAGIGSWSDYTHSGSLYFFYDGIGETFIEQLREFIEHVLQERSDQAAAGRAVQQSPLYYGLSRAYKHGLVLSVLGHKVHAIQFLLEAVWQYVRKELFDKPPLQVRK